MLTLEKNPKIGITSNSVLSGEGKSYERRKFEIECSDFYSKKIKHDYEPIVKIHGQIFFGEEWSSDEWNMFYTFMLHCTEYYLEHGLKGYEHKALKKNKLMQTTSPEFAEWVVEHRLEVKKEYNVKELFEDFKKTYYGDDSRFCQRTFTTWLKKYSSISDLKPVSRRSNGKTIMMFYKNSA
jgi:hypothetical protein